MGNKVVIAVHAQPLATTHKEIYIIYLCGQRRCDINTVGWLMAGLERGYTGMGNKVVIAVHAQPLATTHKEIYI